MAVAGAGPREGINGDEGRGGALRAAEEPDTRRRRPEEEEGTLQRRHGCCGGGGGGGDRVPRSSLRLRLALSGEGCGGEEEERARVLRLIATRDGGGLISSLWVFLVLSTNGLTRKLREKKNEGTGRWREVVAAFY